MSESGIAPFRKEISDEERRALVTVETMDRLAQRANIALDRVVQVVDMGDIGTVQPVRELLAAIRDEAQIRMATAVKDQALSDSIAQEASANVRRHVERRLPGE